MRRPLAVELSPEDRSLARRWVITSISIYWTIGIVIVAAVLASSTAGKVTVAVRPELKSEQKNLVQDHSARGCTDRYLTWPRRSLIAQPRSRAGVSKPPASEGQIEPDRSARLCRVSDSPGIVLHDQHASSAASGHSKQYPVHLVRINGAYPSSFATSPHSFPCQRCASDADATPATCCAATADRSKQFMTPMG